MFTTYNKQLKSYTQDPATAPLETQQRYLFDAGSLPAQPVYLVGRVDAAVDVGAFVYISGSDSQTIPAPLGTVTQYGLVFTKCDPLVSGKNVPVGYVEYKTGDTVAIVRLLSPSTDVAFAAAVVGTSYVIGTDGTFAKVGDSTYPSGVKPYVVGIGLPGSRMLLVQGGSGSADGVSQVNVLPATAISVAGPSTVDKVVDVTTGGLNILGRRLVVEADVTMTASGASTNTVRLTIKLGATTYNLTTSISKSFGGAGSTTYKIRASAVVQVAGASGTLRTAQEVIETAVAPALAVTTISSADLTGVVEIGATAGASAGTTTVQNLIATLI